MHSTKSAAFFTVFTRPGRQAQSPRQLISGVEADPDHLVGQPVGIGLDQRRGVATQPLDEPRRQRRTDAVQDGKRGFELRGR